MCHPGFCGLAQRVFAVIADVYSPSVAMRLQHLCDAVIALEAVAEDSSVVKLAPDPARFGVLPRLRTPCSHVVFALCKGLATNWSNQWSRQKVGIVLQNFKNVYLVLHGLQVTDYVSMLHSICST